jgi:hypothetical protein
MTETHVPRTGGERQVRLAVVFLCFMLVYFTWFPGVFTMDEADIFAQAQGAARHDGHSPLLVHFWSLTGQIALGPAIPYFVALGATLYFTYSVLQRISPTRSAAVVALCALILLPPVFVTLGLVTKDLFFVAAMLAVFVALANYLDRSGRINLLVTALAVLLVVMIRVDGVFALFPLLIYLVWRQLTAARKDSLSIRIIALISAAGLVLCSIGVFKLANRYVFKAAPFHAEQVMMLFDLSAVSVDQDQMLVPVSRLGAGYPLPVLRARFNPAIADVLIWSPDAHRLVYATDANQAELRAAWLRALRDHPLSYLKFRAEYMAQFIGLRNDTARLRGQFAADEGMVEQNSQVWSRTHSPLQQLYYRLSETAWGKYLYVPWLWLLAGLLALFGFAGGWLARTHTRIGNLLPQLLVMSALSYTLLMSTISAAALSRYHSWPRVAIGIAIVTALLQFVSTLRGRAVKAQDRLSVQKTDEDLVIVKD